MKEQYDNLNRFDSLKIIQQMIETAKNEQKDNGTGWIVWGWLLFSASILTVLNMRFYWYETFFFWNVFGIVTIVAGLYKAARILFFQKTTRVKTYTREIFAKLNTGFFFSLMFIIVGMNIGISPIRGFPLLMNLYGFWILIYGTVLNFKPSVIGAYLMWVLAFVALFLPRIFSLGDDGWTTSFTYVMMLHAVGVLFGYIIPGHIANNRFRKEAKDKI